MTFRWFYVSQLFSLSENVVQWSVFLSTTETRRMSPGASSQFRVSPAVPHMLRAISEDLALNSILRMFRRIALTPLEELHFPVCPKDPATWECLQYLNWNRPLKILVALLWLERVGLAVSTKDWSRTLTTHLKKFKLQLNNWVEEECRQGFALCFFISKVNKFSCFSSIGMGDSQSKTNIQQDAVILLLSYYVYIL